MNNNICRARRTDTKEWIDGTPYGDYMICGVETAYGDDEVAASEYPEFDYVPIETETISHYTGVLDVNLSEICENDIVRIADNQTGRVVFACGAFGVYITPYIDYDYLENEIKPRTGCDNLPHFCENDNFVSLLELLTNFNGEENVCSDIEIIGNIFESDDNNAP